MTTTPRLVLPACAGVLVFVPVAASAHPGIAGHIHGFANGFAHPLTGVDHILAMVAVGMFAAHSGGRALWSVPLTFTSVMALAGIAGMACVKLAFAEIGIGLSVVLLGVAVALDINLPTLVAMAVVGLFAIFHGHAHGTEMPASVSGLTYGLGFVCATALLHAVGIGLGIGIGKLGRTTGRRIVQITGAAMALAGAAILISP